MTVTFPSGVPAPGGLTVTENCTVMGRPKVEDAGAFVIRADVAAAPTWWFFAGDALPAKFPSPAYVATTDLVPALVEVRAQLPLGAGPVQVAPLPSFTVTVPVGVPLAGGAAATAKVTM